MSISLLYHTQRVEGYEHVSYEFVEGEVSQYIKRKKLKHICSVCKSQNVTATELSGFRKIRALNMGMKNFNIMVKPYRNRCHDCNAFQMEQISFTSSKYSRISKALERSISELVRYMSIKAVAEYFGLDWGTVKDVYKKQLKKKYARISLRNVRIIGVDEVHMGGKTFLTIVRDLESGAVFFVGRGKGSYALEKFNKKLRRSKAKIKFIAMDMANSYSSWAKLQLPKATIVYDHFHVIKLMNDKLNSVRRRLMSQLDANDKFALKGMRFHLLKNQENLSEGASQELDNCLDLYEEMNKAHYLKEMLRGIYQNLSLIDDVECALEYWHELAVNSDIPEMKTMAKTIKNRYSGILAYWQTGKCISSAAMEGFNNKIGWATRQAYGYRDMEFLELIIYDLPDTKTAKEL